MRTRELSQKYGMCEDAIRKFIKDGLLQPQAGWKQELPFEIDEEKFLKVKRLYWSDRTNFRYQIGWNHSIFHKIDTPEKAYWLGFILADGCLHITGEDFRGHVSIDIGGADKEHLHKFSSFIEATEDMIKTTHHADTGNELVHISLCGKEVVEDLYNLGIRPRKSGRERYIETDFPRDFIRGCYDGDGYIKKRFTLYRIGW